MFESLIRKYAALGSTNQQIYQHNIDLISSSDMDQLAHKTSREDRKKASPSHSQSPGKGQGTQLGSKKTSQVKAG